MMNPGIRKQMEEIVSRGDLLTDSSNGTRDNAISPIYQLLRQMEELSSRHKKLEQEARVRKRVLGLTSHDLMSPINAINGYLDLMKFTLNTGADLQQISEYRSKIKNGLDDISSIVQQLREIGNSDDYDDFVLLEVDLNWVVRNACDIMEGAALNKEHILNCHLTNKPIYVTADLPRLKRIMYNLISNSIKYTPRKGAITVKVSSSDTEAKVSVSDNGVGIPHSAFKDIFKLDKKLQLSGTEKENSSGLGLYISTHFAAQMNGRISLKSKLNQGSQFTLHLPLSGQSNNLY